MRIQKSEVKQKSKLSDDLFIHKAEVLVEAAESSNESFEREQQRVRMNKQAKDLKREINKQMHTVDSIISDVFISPKNGGGSQTMVRQSRSKMEIFEYEYEGEVQSNTYQNIPKITPNVMKPLQTPVIHSTYSMQMRPDDDPLENVYIPFLQERDTLGRLLGKV